MIVVSRPVVDSDSLQVWLDVTMVVLSPAFSVTVVLKPMETVSVLAGTDELVTLASPQTVEITVVVTVSVSGSPQGSVDEVEVV